MKKMAIQVQSVVKEYPGALALAGVSFGVREGAIHGLVGPNGAGKSTTMKIIAGLIPPTSGEVAVCGRVGILPDPPPLYENMRVEEYLRFIQDLHQLDKSRSETEKAREKVVFGCGLNAVARQFIGRLSRGFKQRVGVAQSLMGDPQVVILDEPTVGLDPGAIIEMRETILKLKKDHTVLLSTHRLNEVSHVCEEVTILNRGEVVRSGSLSELEGGKRWLKAVVVRWSEREAWQLRERLAVETIKASDLAGGGVGLQLSFEGGKNRRKPEISRFLSERAGLLEFREERSDLEDLFKEIVD